MTVLDELQVQRLRLRVIGGVFVERVVRLAKQGLRLIGRVIGLRQNHRREQRRHLPSHASMADAASSRARTRAAASPMPGAKRPMSQVSSALFTLPRTFSLTPEAIIFSSSCTRVSPAAGVPRLASRKVVSAFSTSL